MRRPRRPASEDLTAIIALLTSILVLTLHSRASPGAGEPGQVNQLGQGPGATLEHKQAPRLAYTANAAVVCRNKFTLQHDGRRSG